MDVETKAAAADGPDTAPVTLKRGIGLVLLTLYGLGVTVGAGIYVVIGETAGHAGYYTPLAFILAGIVAGLSAASFAELSTRFPVSAGEAAYIEAGLGIRGLPLIAGLAIATSGAISAATLLDGGVGYLRELIEFPSTLVFIGLLAAMASLALWGISQSLTAAAVFTVVELAGLGAIIVFAPADPVTLAVAAYERAPPFDAAVVTGLSASMLLAFFAFIGFEDMVNVVEEVRRPERTMPRAIFLTLALTMILYVWIALIAVYAIPPDRLGESDAPLARLIGATAGGGETLLSLVAITAVLNGVIIQLVMASRILYGLSRQGYLPALVGRVSPVTRTPVIATLLVCAVIAAFGLSLDLASLAATTSSLTLAAFALVNLSLWRIKGNSPRVEGAFWVPRFVPALGFAASAGFLAYDGARRLIALAGGL